MKSVTSVFVSLIALVAIIIAAILFIGETELNSMNAESSVSVSMHDSSSEMPAEYDDRATLHIESRSPGFAFDKHDPEVKSYYIYEKGMRKSLENC